MPRVSVVIPAFHSEATVAGCLDALRAQTFRDFQVILVNSSQGDRTPAIVRREFPEVELFESPIRLLPHAARNHGVAHASGRILVFTDPDCRGRPDWLAWIVAACDAGHQVVGGPIMAARAATRNGHGIHIAKFHMCLGGGDAGGGDDGAPLPRDLPTANACYTRAAWAAVGPFPAAYMCGDSLLAQRAHNRGYRIWFEPRAIVEHVGSDDVRGFVRERYRRGREYGRAIWDLGDRSRVRAALGALAAPARVLSALVRVGRHSRDGHQGRRFRESLPLQVVAHGAWCAGEAWERARQAMGWGARLESSARSESGTRLEIGTRSEIGTPDAMPGSRITEPRARVPAAHEAIVIGAGPAGLAVAASLGALGGRATVLERGNDVGAGWRRHYDSLRLHTTRGQSQLPYARFAPGVSRYPSRDELADHLVRYRDDRGLDVRTGIDVVAVRRRPQGWIVETTTGVLTAPVVVVATGFNRVPVRPRWPGDDVFRGRLLHSVEFRSGAAFTGQRVLVVGLGNSAADIAVDLVKHGARVSIAVRGPVFLVPAELAGVCWRGVFRVVPELAISAGKRLGRGGAIAAAGSSAMLWYAIQRARFGDLRRHHVLLETPLQIAARWRARRSPLVPGPLVPLIRTGEVEVLPAVAAFEPDAVTFADGIRRGFDSVVLATGFRPGLEDFLEDAARYVDQGGVPRVDGAPAMAPDIFFCGYRPDLGSIGASARGIAAAIAGRLPGGS